MAEKSLTLQSSNEELKAYFEAVCKIVDSNTEEFPINLDEVWPLAYAEKGAAVRALKNGFIEDVDYKTIDTFTKREIGSTRTTNYFMRFGSKKPTTLAVGGIEPHSFFG